MAVTEPDRSMRGSMRGSTRESSRESGSAYLAVLLVLLLLSIIAISLVLVTQVESEIGVNERMVHRSFYAADSGLSAAVARKMSGASGPFRFDMNADDGGIFRRGDAVEVGNFLPVRIGFCNLCSANVGSEYHRIDYLAASQATRFGTATAGGGNRVPIARQAVSGEIAIQPETGPGDFLGLGKRSGRRLGELLGRTAPAGTGEEP
jgi:hypothetical protein